MGLLPSVRTTPAPPFSRTGIDFAGPLTLRVGHTRRPVHLKCWVAVFVCLTTKAVHLDLCTSLSTPDFLAVLRRFVARRGCPNALYSDNGSNFVGAREELRIIQKMTRSETFQKAIIDFTSQRGIEWSHIPPRAPHFGGLWEAAVKAMKTCLRKVVSPHALTFDELYTVLTESEATLNSRPLAPLTSEDLLEGGSLTAGHFLVGRPLKALPTRIAPSGKMSLLRRWNLVQRLQSDLWRHWLSSYLSSIASRAKWIKLGYQLKQGDVVLLKDESLRTRSWPLAVVECLHPGTDGVSRAATIRCQGKTYLRPTNKLVPLLTDQDEDNLQNKERSENSVSESAPLTLSAPTSLTSNTSSPPEYVRAPQPNRRNFTQAEAGPQ